MLDRRTFMLTGSAVALVPGNVAASEPIPDSPAISAGSKLPPAQDALLALTSVEAALLSALVDGLIPADVLSPSGTDCGVVTFIDRQLAGAFGAGSRLYLDGPFHASNAPTSLGYQSPMTPLQLIQTGSAELDTWAINNRGRAVAQLVPTERDALLHELEGGKIDLPRVGARTFFDMLLQLTMEGFFSDPIYGGNRDMASWRMIGYPGLPATYAKSIRSYRGRRYEAEPRSIANFL